MAAYEAPIDPATGLPTEEILLRSPFWVEYEDANLDYILVDLRVWIGEVSAEPANPDVTLRSKAFDGKASVDIAEFARDFVEVTISTGSEAAESSAVWISFDLTWVLTTEESTTDPTAYFIGLDGYGTFHQGNNFQNITYQEVMLSSPIVNAYPDISIRVPVRQDKLIGYELQTRNWNVAKSDTPNTPYTTFHTVSGLTPSTNTADAVVYISSSHLSNVADRILLHFEQSPIPYPDETVDINYLDCTKYGYNKVYFVNKFGCVQEQHFAGRYSVAVSTNSSEFTRNLLDNGSYSSTRHQKVTMNKNGTIKFTINTGWVDETENDTFLEMMMSEQVWVRCSNDALGIGWLPKTQSSWNVPCKLTSKDYKIKTIKSDKMISYTFEFTSANDWINTVR